MTKRLLFLLLWAAPIFGQGTYVPARTVNSSVNGVLRPVQATITVCAANTSGIPCSPALAGVLFKDSALTQPLVNPTTTDANGNYPQMALAGGNYTITESAVGFTGFSYQMTISCSPGPCTVTSLTTTGNVTVGGNLSVTGAFSPATIASFNGTIFCDGAKYTSLNAAAAAVPNPGTLVVMPTCPAQVGNLGIPNTTTLWVFGQAQLNRNGFNLSINGPIIAGPSQIITGGGTTTICDTNVSAACNIGPVYANWFPGADIDAQINAALVAVTTGGLTFPEVKVANAGPNGYTSVTTTISVPYKSNSGFKLTLESGVVINFTGTGNSDWLDYFATASGQNNRFTLDMRGAKVIGNSAAGSCIHFRQIIGATLYEPYCTLFSNGTSFLFGDGLLFEGVLDANIYSPMLIANNVGSWLVPSTNAAGNPSGSNTNTFVGGRIQSNVSSGAVESAGPNPGTFQNIKNLYGYAGDIEGNGSNNPVTVGSLTASLTSNVVTITGAGTANNIFAGMYAIQSGFSGGTVSLSCLNLGSSTQGGVLILGATSNTYTYNCTGANGSGTGSGSVTAYPSQGVLENSQQVTFSNIFSQWGSGTGFMAEYIVGSNAGIGGPSNNGIRFDDLHCASNNQSAECIFTPGAKNLILSGSTQEGGSTTNLLQCGNSGMIDTLLLLTGAPVNGGVVSSGCGWSTTATVVMQNGGVVIGAGSPITNSGPGGALTASAFNLPTLTNKQGSGAGNYTNATTSYTVADSTNLCLTVTIPTGWKLGISASGALSTATAAVVAQAALTDNASCSTANAGILIETAPIQGSAIGVADAFALNWVITGNGAAHNIALQFKTSNAADTASLINSSATIVPTMKFELMPSN